jgi:hypothetical protein
MEDLSDLDIVVMDDILQDVEIGAIEQSTPPEVM